jgi:hypothetical protein
MGVYAGVEKTWASQTDVGRIHIATKGIVQSGLVLNLDAGASTSYPGSGTTWSDLSSGGNTGTLTNGPTYSSANGGSIVFDGTNDYVLRTSSINTGQNFTVSVWSKKTKSGRNSLVANSYPYDNDVGWYFFIGGSGLSNNLTLSIGKDQSFVNTSPNALNDNQWYNFTGIVENGGVGIKLYINSILQTNDATNSSISSVPISIVYTTARCEIGSVQVSPIDYLGGNIAQVSIYNRALSAAEVSQNFNALRSRYGI